METGEIVRLIVGTIIIIAAAYYCTYWLANRKLRQVAGRGIRVLERFSLSKDKLFCTIEVNGKVYLLALTNGAATVIDTFDAAEYVQNNESGAPAAFEPRGIAQKALYGVFNAARSAGRRKSGGNDSCGSFAQTFEQSEKSADNTLRTAKEEDSIDELQRRLKNRRAAPAAPAGGEERRED